MGGGGGGGGSLDISKVGDLNFPDTNAEYLLKSPLSALRLPPSLPPLPSSFVQVITICEETSKKCQNYIICIKTSNKMLFCM